ncbi:O-methyltransferase [Corynebacterium lizhenjunii]|uniref:O-methyltransferase n=1 Tax=Corynebacterium lizhenjunii TaxID=2709394 RepID=UPI0013EA08DD|nr:class I SAM-dependent methyltransferase [Corynebacterium lizhenjunii]
MTSTAFDALRAYIEQTSSADDALAGATAHATEFALPFPDAATGQLLTTLTAAATRHGIDKPQAIAITPAASVVGLYLLNGLPDSGILSCIDPEAEHQANAKATFRAAGYAASRVRFLPSRPLDVIERLATSAYQLIYADVPTMDLLALLKTAWPLLSPGGTLVVANSLLDGTIADPTRTDRATLAAREADDYARDLDGAVLTRLPLGAGLTLLTKR